MKTHLFKLGLIGGILFLTGCKKDPESNKIIHGLPVDTVPSVTAAEASQQNHLLARDIMRFVVPILNRLSTIAPTFDDLTPIGGSKYSFTIAHSRYGNPTLALQFFNSTPAVIDPIVTHSLATSIKTVEITGTSHSAQFSYTVDLVLTLAVAGDMDSNITASGTVNFSGQNLTMNFAFPAVNGPEVSFEGIFKGAYNATGTGPDTNPVSTSLFYNVEHEGNGTLTWENQTGGFHIDEDGTAVLVTNQKRFLLD